MGLPVNKFICASNENKALTDFFETGVYDANREFHVTTSPSMDILISSNLERLLWHLSGENSAEVSGYMKSLEDSGRYEVSAKIREGMKDFYGGFADMKGCAKALGDLWSEEKYLIDTHTAVAYKVYMDYVEKTGDHTPAIVACTASAYKFAGDVAAAIGLPPQADGFASVDALGSATGVPVPEGLKGLKGKSVLHKEILTAEEMPKAIKEALGIKGH
jgi:threonine synthase